MQRIYEDNEFSIVESVENKFYLERISNRSPNCKSRSNMKDFSAGYMMRSKQFGRNDNYELDYRRHNLMCDFCGIPGHAMSRCFEFLRIIDRGHGHDGGQFYLEFPPPP